MARNPAFSARRAAYALITPTICSGFSAARTARKRSPAEISAIPSSSDLDFTGRARPRQHPLRGFHHRRIDHFALQHIGSRARGLVLLSSLDHPQGMRDVLIAGAERFLDRPNLVGVYGLLTGISHPRAFKRFGAQP